MKKLTILFAFLLGFVSLAQAQYQKVDWKVNTTKLENDTYKVELIATVEDGWYIYSQHIDEGGPKPTEFLFKGKGFELSGKTDEASKKTVEGFDPAFELDVKKFGGTVTFTQVVKKVEKNPTMTASIVYMSCNDEMCLPPKRLQLPVIFN